MLLAFALAAVFIGGIHCAAWNFLFPTPIEGLLWRIASVLILVLPFLEFLTLLADDAVSNNSDEVEIFRWAGMYIFPGLYAILRLFLIIEMFISLRSVPPEVYHQLPWSDFIPHL